MDLRTIVLIVLRRWYVAVPIALLGLYIAMGSGGSPTYSVNASFLLVTLPDGATDEVSNPILETPAAVNAAANVAVVVMQTENRRLDVAEAGYATDYGFSVAREDPFVTLDVSHADSAIAIESTTVLARLFEAEMAEQQLRFGADAGALVQAELLEISEPVADYSAVRTSQATVAMLGFLLAFLAAFGVEGVLYFFSDRRREFAEFDRYEHDAALYGLGDETAADYRPTGSGPAPLRAAPSTELESPRGSRWARQRLDRGTGE